MDPLSLGIAGVGLGMKIIGGMEASSSQSAAYAAQQDEATQENNVNAVKEQAMYTSANRQQLENFRNVQRQRAAGLNASVNQGAQFGSGMAGGQAQATAQGLFNSQGINQSVQEGAAIFGYDAKINQDKSAIAGFQSSANTDMGWANLGGSLMSSAGTLGNIGGAASKGIGSALGNMFIPSGALSGGYGNQ